LIGFFYIAKGSAAELITQLEIARDAGLLAAAVADLLIEQSEVISRKLGALIQAACASFYLLERPLMGLRASFR
jgi:four helix bundle protein